ncbi:MAG: hypothetical protein RR630_07770 [Coprobacillus sp.]
MKKFIFCLCAVLLVGCGGNSSTGETSKEKTLYEGLDGKQTYVAAVEFFNKNATYYKMSLNSDGMTSEKEYYNTDNKISTVEKTVYDEGEESLFTYMIAEGSHFHSLIKMTDDTFKYNVVDDYTATQTTLYKDYTKSEGSEVYDVQREDKNGKVILTVKMKVSETFAGGDDEFGATEDSYIINVLTIDEKGYITEESKTVYADKDFKEVEQENIKVDNEDINKKNATDLKNEVELMKACEGLTQDEVKAKLNFK